MFYVDDVVAYGEVAEVGDEGGGLGFAAADGARGDVGFVGEILRAEDDDLAGGGLSRSRTWTPAAMVVLTMTGVRRSPAR